MPWVRRDSMTAVSDGRYRTGVVSTQERNAEPHVGGLGMLSLFAQGSSVLVGRDRRREVGKDEAKNLEGESEKSVLERLRTDFKLVWNWWRHCGEISEDEMRDGMKEAGEVIRKNIGEADWMRDCAATFSEIAAPSRADLARSERIRAEVRAEKEAA